MSKTRNYPTNHVSHPNIGDVTNHEDGTCTFKIDTIPDKGVRTISLHYKDRTVLSISIGPDDVCYQILDQGQDMGMFTLWDDEV